MLHDLLVSLDYTLNPSVYNFLFGVFLESDQRAKREQDVTDMMLDLAATNALKSVPYDLFDIPKHQLKHLLRRKTLQTSSVAKIEASVVSQVSVLELSQIES